MTSDDINNLANFVDAPKSGVIIKAIGVGGGGNNAVNHMFAQNIEQVSFAVCNTDRQALNNSPVPNRVLLGPSITGGLGAGNDPEIAKQAAEESADEISQLFDDGTKMVFITAGMGGGTGTGAAPVVAKIARDRGLLTVGIVTIPFLFEGERKILKALDGAEELSKYVDSLLVVNNEQLTEIYPDLDWINAFGKADDTLSTAARSISELITCTGHINLDFKDVDKTLRNGGAAIISTGYGEGEHRVTKAIDDALNSPLLKNRDIMGSKHLLFNLYFSREAEHKFAMGEANELTSFISQIDKNVDVIYGIAFDETLGDKIKITILASGFELVIKGDRKLKPKQQSEIFPTKHKGFTPTADETAEQPAAAEVLAGAYGKDKIDNLNKQRETLRYVILRPEQFNDDAVIEKFERNPAYNRDRAITDELRNDTPASRASQASAPLAASGPLSPAAPADQPRPSASVPPASREIKF
mgnify:CR=1 FL=1